MTCNTCGELVEVTESSGGVKEGQFSETHECLNGHLGYVHGEASRPEQWTYTGAVYE